VLNCYSFSIFPNGILIDRLNHAMGQPPDQPWPTIVKLS
jgi:hypothetical protein